MSALVVVAVVLVGCQGRPASTDHQPATPTVSASIVEVHDGTVDARVESGPPCHAKVDGFAIVVTGPPLVAEVGVRKFTSEVAPNGLTIRDNGVGIARLYDQQLFDDSGIPLLKVLPEGDVVNPAGQIVRKAVVGVNQVSLTGDGPEVVVTGTTNPALAAFLATPRLSSELRALIACHYLLPAAAPAEPKD